MAVRNSGGHTPKKKSAPKRGGSETPFKGSRRCARCGLFHKEERMIECVSEGRFYGQDSKYYVCFGCNKEEGVVDPLKNHIERYDDVSDGFGWER